MTAALEGGQWSAASPGRTLPPGIDVLPIVHEAEGASGPVWTGGKSRPHRDSIPDRPARSQSLYRLSYPAHAVQYRTHIFTLWDPMRSQHLLQYNLHKTVKISKVICRLVGGCKSSKMYVVKGKGKAISV